MSTPNKINKSMNIKCQWCGAVNTVKKWDDNTYAQCTTDEMRDDYLSLEYTRTFNEEEDTLYKCPDCGWWLKANQLVLLTDNRRLRKLGGRPIITFEGLEVKS